MRQGSLVALYKLIEIVEELFGGRRRKAAGSALGVTKELELIGLLANESSVDERHAPKLNEQIQPLSAGDRVEAIAAARRIVRALEKQLFKF